MLAVFELEPLDVLGDVVELDPLFIPELALPVVLPVALLLRTMFALTSQHWLDDAPLEVELLVP